MNKQRLATATPIYITLQILDAEATVDIAVAVGLQYHATYSYILPR